MGFVTNRWQPVSASPGPTPLPAWELLKSEITASTAFDYASYDYTEYLFLVKFYDTNVSGNYIWEEFFWIPEFATIKQTAGYLSSYVNFTSDSNYIRIKAYYGTSDFTSNARYTVYGRKKTSWNLVSDNSALPNYTELATCNGYYTPFNYQVSDYRASGGYDSIPTASSISNFHDYRECVYNNAYTHNYGSDAVYTRLSSNEPAWTHINSTTDSVSIANISFSEMFIVGRRMGINSYDNFQAVYLIPDMLSANYMICAGGRTKYSGSTTGIRGGWGRLTITTSTISAFYRTRTSNSSTNNTFTSLDIYYR